MNNCPRQNPAYRLAPTFWVRIAVFGDYAIAGNSFFVHAKIGVAMLHENIPFLKTIFVKQDFNPLPGTEFALGVLGCNPRLTAAQLCLGAFLL